MKRMAVYLTLVTALGAAAAFLVGRAPGAGSLLNSAFGQTKWPFLLDQWGTGEAFVCQPADCGVKIEVYIRPKIGFCNCSDGVYDDDELERVGDTELVSRDIDPLDEGQPITAGWLHGRSRIFFATDYEGREQWLISVAFHDGCDAVVALADVGQGDATALEPSVIAFLEKRLWLRWVKKELGLEYVYRRYVQRFL
jgi:hypothetical protein